MQLLLVIPCDNFEIVTSKGLFDIAKNKKDYNILRWLKYFILEHRLKVRIYSPRMPKGRAFYDK